VKVRWESDDSLIATYKYDAEGRRVEKSVVSGPLERYIHSGRQVVSSFGSGNTWKQNFVWSDWIDDIEMLEQADVLDYDDDTNATEITRSYYHKNALGSVMTITDADEVEVASYRYNAYGTMAITIDGTPHSVDPLGQHWGFTGRFFDEESGNWYIRARYYEPTSGRFLSRDPLGIASGPNAYEYAVSSPVVLTDPTGLAPNGRGPSAGGINLGYYEKHFPSESDLDDFEDDARYMQRRWGGDLYWYKCWLWWTRGDPVARALRVALTKAFGGVQPANSQREAAAAFADAVGTGVDGFQWTAEALSTGLSSAGGSIAKNLVGEAAQAIGEELGKMKYAAELMRGYRRRLGLKAMKDCDKRNGRFQRRKRPPRATTPRDEISKERNVVGPTSGGAGLRKSASFGGVSGGGIDGIAGIGGLGGRGAGDRRGLSGGPWGKSGVIGTAGWAGPGMPPPPPPSPPPGRARDLLKSIGK